MASGPIVGATPPSTPVTTTRSGIAAAQASAYGPPPESPMTAISSIPRTSAMVRRSSANANTFRYWNGVEEPMPGRSTPINLMCFFSA